MRVVRSFSGRWVAVGLIVLAVGGTILLNVTTSGPSKALLDALAASPTSPGATATATVVVAPSSSPAEPGLAYPVTIVGECGVAGPIDFDGSFWEPADGRSLQEVGGRLRPPVDPATIALEGGSSALLRTAAGQTVALARSPSGRLTVRAC
ncbi:MAG TPA: hypothetical protein VGB19_07080 [Actinomycetota bacterium]